VPELDRHRIRSVFERRFAARRMAEDYVHQYQELINGRSKPRLAV